MTNDIFFHNILMIVRRLRFILIFRSKFSRIGRSAFINSPFRIDGPNSISIGENTFIQSGVWLYCHTTEQTSSIINIGANCVLGYRNHITSNHRVDIGDYVLTANNVFIGDNNHGFDNPEIPIIQQPIQHKRDVSIGFGSWIGENVCIIGASIGRNCVIGANSVVISDIPDFSIAAGNPARVIGKTNSR